MSFELTDNGEDLLAEIQGKLLGSLSKDDARHSKIDVLDIEHTDSRPNLDLLSIEDIKYKELAQKLCKDLIPRLVELDCLASHLQGTMVAICLTRIYRTIETYHENFLKSDKDWTENDTMALLLVTLTNREL